MTKPPEQKSGDNTQTALALFDSLETVSVSDILGSWKGGKYTTGHELDGVLEQFHWHGKNFIDAETVDPLVFSTPNNQLFTVNPRFMPMTLARKAKFLRTDFNASLFLWLRPLFSTSKPKARLRMVEHRGKTSAAMVYDDLPIIDHFRLREDKSLLGLMDMRGMDPFFFTLTRKHSA